MTADDLRKVYDSVAANRQAEAHGAGFDTVHGDALLAVARHVAQRQRDADLVRFERWTADLEFPCGTQAQSWHTFNVGYREFVNVTPLVTDTPGGSDDSV